MPIMPLSDGAGDRPRAGEMHRWRPLACLRINLRADDGVQCPMDVFTRRGQPRDPHFSRVENIEKDR